MINAQRLQESRMFICRFLTCFFFANVIIFWIVGAGYLNAILTNAALFNNSMVAADSLIGKSFVVIFAVVNYLSYLMFLALIPGIFVYFISFFIPNRRFIFLISIFMASIAVIALLVDSRVFSLFKFHLNETLIRFVFSPQWREVFDFSNLEILLIAVFIVLILIIESGLAWFVYKKMVFFISVKFLKNIAYFWISCMVFSYLTLIITISKTNNLLSQQIPNLPLFTQIVSYTIPDPNGQEIIRRYSETNFTSPNYPDKPLHYPQHLMHCQKPTKPYNIFFIMVDSLRFDSIQEKFMPNVASFAATAWQFNHHLSGGNATQAGLFSLFYSISSNYWTATISQKIRPVFFDLLERFGYHMEIIWSSELTNPPFDKNVFLQIKNIKENVTNEHDSGAWDRETTQQAILFLKSNKNKKEPFFLHLFYDAPHGFCGFQSYPTPFEPFKNHCSRLIFSNNSDPAPFYNRYLNSVKFVDGEIGKVLDAIKEGGYLENSIIVFTSDHGQEFNDNHQNYWGHSSNFTDAEVKVPMLLYWPHESAKQFDHLTSSYDVIPSLLTRLFGCSNPMSDYSLGQNLWESAGRLPFLLAGSYINMAIIEPDRLTTLETSGRIVITDKKAAPLPKATPRPHIMEAALVLLRKYFSG